MMVIGRGLVRPSQCETEEKKWRDDTAKELRFDSVLFLVLDQINTNQ